MVRTRSIWLRSGSYSSEVGGGESNREIVSFRSCARTRGVAIPSQIQGQFMNRPLSLFPLSLRFLPFSLGAWCPPFPLPPTLPTFYPASAGFISIYGIVIWPGYGVAWPGYDVAWPGYGVAWPGYGVAWLGYGVAWLGMAWPGWVWRDLAGYTSRAMKNLKI